MMLVNRKYGVPFSREMTPFRLLTPFPLRRIVLRGATHLMWFEQSEACRKAVLDFWREQAKD